MHTKSAIELDLDGALAKKDWTRRQLAEAMKVSVQWIQQLCTDKNLNVTLGTIERIAKAMEIDAQDLLR